MDQFDYITDADLRKNLESDYQELQECHKAGAKKAALVLAGSIVEAVLIDALTGVAGMNDKDLVKKTFEDLIKTAKENKYLDADTEPLSTVIRNYRNLIHPGRVKRLEKEASAQDANIAIQVVDKIIIEISRQKRSTYGFTAQQLVNRLESGLSALPVVVGHLLKDVRPVEIEHLLTTVLPQRYFAMSGKAELWDAADHLQKCYWAIFETLSGEMKRYITAQIYELYRSADEELVCAWEKAFFRCSQFEYLSSDQRRLIWDHIRSELSNGSSLDQLEGIGSFVTQDMVYDLTHAMVNHCVSNWDPINVQDIANSYPMRCLQREFLGMTEDCRETVVALLDKMRGLETVAESFRRKDAALRHFLSSGLPDWAIPDGLLP